MAYRITGHGRTNTGESTANAIIAHERLRSRPRGSVRHTGGIDIEAFATNDGARFAETALATLGLVLLVCNWDAAVSLVPTIAGCSAATTLLFGPSTDSGLLFRTIAIGSMAVPAFLCSCIASNLLRGLKVKAAVTQVGTFVTIALGWIAVLDLAALVAVNITANDTIAPLMAHLQLQELAANVPYMIVWMLLILGVVVTAALCAHGHIDKSASGLSAIMRSLLPTPATRLVAVAFLMIVIPLLAACAIIAAIVLGLAALAAIGTAAIIVISILLMPLIIWTCLFSKKIYVRYLD